MRAMVWLVLLLPVAVVHADDAPKNPFDGWSAEQIAKHRAKAEVGAKKTLETWLTARRLPLGTCRTCGGVGHTMVHSARGANAVKIECPTCRKSGKQVTGLLAVYWNHYSPRYRTAARRKLMQPQLDAARSAKTDPMRIEAHRNIRIEVKGAYARAKVEVKRGGVWREEEHVLIEDPAGTWCLYHPVADAKFTLFGYPVPVAEGD